MTTGALVALSGICALTACAPPTPQIADYGEPAADTAAGPPSSVVATRLDSGNVAFSAGDYQAALHHYEAAAREAPTVPATWFGVYIAQRALGNDEAADSALRRARARMPASLQRPGTRDTSIR